MTIERMIELLEIEHECMLRGAHDDCDRKCADCELVQEDDELHEMYTNVVWLLKEQEEQIKNRDESLEKAREEIKWLRRMLKEQEAKAGKWIPIESPTGVEAFGVKEMTVMNVRCSVCGSEEDVSFTGYKYCPRCGAKMEGR